ncbi:MAG: peptidoglycan-binding protein, partial [Leptolyngbyaceae cyanobacterium]
MTYRVALLALTSVAVLASPLGGFAQAREDDDQSFVAQAPILADPPAEPASEDGSLTPDSTDAEAESEPSNQASSPLPSEEVRALQQQLGRLGYYQGAVDGILGTETSEAVS